MEVRKRLKVSEYSHSLSDIMMIRLLLPGEGQGEG